MVFNNISCIHCFSCNFVQNNRQKTRSVEKDLCRRRPLGGLPLRQRRRNPSLHAGHQKPRSFRLAMDIGGRQPRRRGLPVLLWRGVRTVRAEQGKTADDWIISPAVSLKAGRTYRVTASVRNLSPSTYDRQSFTVTAGMTPDVSGMTQAVFSETALETSKKPVERDGVFTPASSGTTTSPST